jgi:peptidoglycan/xylan/chitin deacetylase (PgdA/CDA1 family)
MNREEQDTMTEPASATGSAPSTGTTVLGPPRDLVGYAGSPPAAAWPGGARIAICLVVNYEEGSELAVGDGDATTDSGVTDAGWARPGGERNLTLESMFEYGSRAGFWRLMDIFDEHDVRCTFYACAVALERNPEAAAMMRPKGHDVMSHGYRWEDHAGMTEDQERERIRLAVESITRTTGERPLGWYCRYGPNVHTRELVVQEGGFVYDSDDYGDDLPFFTEVGGTRHLVVPYSLVNNDGIFGAAGPGEDFEEHLRYTFDRLYAEGATTPKLMNIGLHMRLVGNPGRAQALSNFIAYAKSFPDVWFARRIDVARHWIEQHG